MTQFYITGDPTCLRSRASVMNQVSLRLYECIGRLDVISANAIPSAGPNAITKNLQGAISSLQNRLRNAADHFEQASSTLTVLAHMLEALETSAHNSFRDQGSPTPGIHEHALFQLHFLDPLQMEADRARRSAASTLSRLAGQAPWLPPHESTWSLFLHGFEHSTATAAEDTGHALWGLGKDIGGLVVGVGKFAGYDGTLQVFVNPDGFAKSWRRVLDGIGNVATHPGQFFDGMYQGLVQPDLWKKDPAAWLAVTGVTLLAGDGIAKAFKAVSSTSKLARGADALDEGANALRTETAGRSGQWNPALNKPLANTKYVVDGKFTYITNASGKVGHAEMNLSDVVRADRNKYQQWRVGGQDRLIGDEGGHIFATAVGGPGEAINLTSMDAAINQSIYKQVEAEWIRAAEQGKQVTVGVDIQWDVAGNRPSGYLLMYTIDGKSSELMLDNTSYPLQR